MDLQQFAQSRQSVFAHESSLASRTTNCTRSEGFFSILARKVRNRFLLRETRFLKVRRLTVDEDMG